MENENEKHVKCQKFSDRTFAFSAHDIIFVNILALVSTTTKDLYITGVVKNSKNW